MKQVIVVRKDLKMRKGKLAAQVAHASLKAIINEEHEVINDPRIIEWMDSSYTKVVVSVENEQELLNVYNIAKSRTLSSLITDEGRTEFNGVPTLTTCGVGPDRCDIIDEITGNLKLI